MPVQWADRDVEYVRHADVLSAKPIKPTNFKNSDLRFMSSDYTFGILDLWLLITPLGSYRVLEKKIVLSDIRTDN